MSNESPSNHGEGNPEAAERFNRAERDFVGSDRGKQKIKDGAQMRPNEQAELERAEQLGRERAKDDDSASGKPVKR
jgi:hypothetical protein